MVHSGRKLYTPFEKTLLQELLKEKLDIIECKETDKVTTLRKQAAFIAVAESFNSSSNITTKRSAKQIKEFYKTSKKMTGTKFANGRQKWRATDHSSTSMLSPDDFEDRLAELQAITFDSDEMPCETNCTENLKETEELVTPDIVITNPVSLCDLDDLNKGSREECLDSTRLLAEEQTQRSLVNESTPNALNQDIPPMKASTVLELFRKKMKSRQAPAATSRAAAAIEEERRLRIKFLMKEERRKIEKHELKTKEIKANIKLIETKQLVQERLLQYLESNPSRIVFHSD